MDDAKKVFAIFLGLLFTIILVGVFISRVGEKNKDKPISGALERIFFKNRPTVTPAIGGKVAEKNNTGENTNTVTVEKTSESTSDTIVLPGSSSEDGDNEGTVAGEGTAARGADGVDGSTKGGSTSGTGVNSDNDASETKGGSTSNIGADSDNDASETKGGQPAEAIPATGTPEVVLLAALMGLASGIILRRSGRYC